MQKKMDWKDVAGSYYEKSLSLAILILLFSFLVSPKMEMKPFERKVKEIISIDIPPEIKEKIKPPEQIVKPQIEIIVDEEMSDDEDEDIEIIDTIEKTTLDITEIVETEVINGKTPKFVAYEKAPVPIKQPPPEYPPFAMKSGLEGDVWVEAEVFTNGKVGAVEIKKSLLAGPGGLDEAAIKAVKQWEFQPAESGGKPVACWVTFPVGFYLE